MQTISRSYFPEYQALNDMSSRNPRDASLYSPLSEIIWNRHYFRKGRSQCLNKTHSYLVTDAAVPKSDLVTCQKNPGNKISVLYGITNVQKINRYTTFIRCNWEFGFLDHYKTLSPMNQETSNLLQLLE